MDMIRNVSALNGSKGFNWTLVHGDCVPVLEQIPDRSIGFSVYSPPFSSLFTYSDSASDMGNCAGDAEFFKSYGFLVEQLTRVMKPGRLVAIHCSDLPLSKWKDGVIGLKDFPADIRAAHEAYGWIYHSKITVWKDPVVEMVRTNALGLLYKQLQKDSVRSRVGMPDYIIVMRAPGENAEPVGQDKATFPVEQWQKWASPVWMDIRQTDTLNVKQARARADERHICPLQIGLIRRAITLWSNRGDVVLSPFAGIGSEGFSALKLHRKFLGVELKKEYYEVAKNNLMGVENSPMDMFEFDDSVLEED